MDRNMQRYYSEWLYAMKEHWRKSGGQTNPEVAKKRPYNNVSPANCEELCNHWSSGTQQAISQRNKANRAKMSMLGGHGSKTIVAHFCEIVRLHNLVNLQARSTHLKNSTESKMVG